MDDHIQQVAPMRDVEIEQKATCLLNRFQPDRLQIPGPTNIVQLFESCSLIVPGSNYGVEDLPFGEMGRLTPDGDVELSESTYVGALEDDPRCRWTIAHELGHLVLHSKQIKRMWTEGRMGSLARATDVPPYRNPEIQAHKFAAELLCPMRAAWLLLKDSPRVQWAPRICDTFLVSKEAAQKRAESFEKFQAKNHRQR